MVISERIAHGYFFAKHYIISKGFGNEIDWQDGLNYDQLTEQKIIHEFTWVILASGMNDKVVRKIFPLVKKAMLNFESARKIHNHRDKCLYDAMKVLNHRGKIQAILSFIEYINVHSFSRVKNQIKINGIDFIQTFSYMGKATSYHFAKNIGLNVAKPDRHLIRIVNILGYDDPHTFCDELANQINEKASLIDLVLWRYATLDKNYVETISWFYEKTKSLPQHRASLSA